MFEYLASPYTDPDSIVMNDRYLEAMRAASWLLNKGVYVFSPITHCHPMAVMYGLPRDHMFWLKYDEAMVTAAKGIIILMIPGWMSSKGVKNEIDLAEKQGKPIKGMVPNGSEDPGYVFASFGHWKGERFAGLSD